MIVTSTSIMIVGRLSLRIVRPARAIVNQPSFGICVQRRRLLPGQTWRLRLHTDGEPVEVVFVPIVDAWPITRIPQLCAGRGQRSERHLHLFHARAIAGSDSFLAGRLGRRRCAAGRFRDPADASTHSRWCRVANAALSLMADPLVRAPGEHLPWGDSGPARCRFGEGH